MSRFSESSDKFKTGTTNFKNGMKSFVKWVLFIALVVSIAVMVFLYYGTYSTGVRAGVILKVSEKGALFKTYEGQMDLMSFGAVKDRNQLSQTFEFSVYKDDFRTIQVLEDVALNGERVNLRYEEKYVALPWRGDTKYFAIGVERISNPVRKGTDKNNYPE